MKYKDAEKEALMQRIKNLPIKKAVKDAAHRDKKYLKGRKAEDDAAKEQEDRNDKFDIDKWKKANK